MTPVFDGTVPVESAFRGVVSREGLDLSSPSALLACLERQQGWRPAMDPGRFSDLEVFDDLVDSLTADELMFITDVSYRKGQGAFVVTRQAIPEFVSTFRARTGERLFNGDVLIVDARAARVWVLHHEGVCGAFDL